MITLLQFQSKQAEIWVKSKTRSKCTKSIYRREMAKVWNIIKKANLDSQWCSRRRSKKCKNKKKTYLKPSWDIKDLTIALGTWWELSVSPSPCLLLPGLTQLSRVSLDWELVFSVCSDWQATAGQAVIKCNIGTRYGTLSDQKQNRGMSGLSVGVLYQT